MSCRNNRKLEDAALRHAQPKPKLHPDVKKCMKKYVWDNEMAQELANAIIVQASEDYISAKRRLKKYRDSTFLKETVIEIEQFLRSDWFAMMTNLDAEWLLARLRAEARNPANEK